MKSKSKVLLEVVIRICFFLILLVGITFSCENDSNQRKRNVISQGLKDSSSLCRRSDSLVEIELGYGNRFYFPHMDLHSKYRGMPYFDPCFADIMWRKYKIIVAFPFDDELFDSCFQVKMNAIVLKAIGYQSIVRTLQEVDSLKRILPNYRYLDSSYYNSSIKPTFPGGNDHLVYELFIVDKKVQYNTSIWIDAIIDTNGNVTNVEIIRAGSPQHNKSLLNKIENHMLPFTPAYNIDRKKASSNTKSVKYKKVRFKRRFVCQIIKSRSDLMN